MNELSRSIETAETRDQSRLSKRMRGVITLMAMLIIWLAAPMRVAWAGPQAATRSTEPPASQSVAVEPVDDGEDDDDDIDDDIDNDDGAVDDDDDDWEGLIVVRPVGLIGTWVLQIAAGVTLTVTTDAVTEFEPSDADAYAIGSWVKVKGMRQPNGDVNALDFELDDFEDGELVVRLRSADDAASVEADYELELVQSLLLSGDIYLFRTTDDDELASVDELMLDERIIWAEVNYVNSVPEGDGYKTWAWGGATEPDTYVGQSAFLQAGLGQEAKQFRGEDVVIAILDTGIYTAHEQFQGRLRLPSRDVIGDDSDPSEVGPGLAWGHGTHVAGVIAAMAPEATLLPVRVLDANGRGNTFLLAYAIEWAADQPGVEVINLSLGTDGNSKVLEEVIGRVLAQGKIVVAAAGNGGVDTPQYPAAYEGVIGVTAVDESNRKPSFANYGAAMVDVAAPGVGIMSTMINDAGPGYASWSGTSMSTAFVTGAVALLVEQNDPAPLTSALVLSRLVDNGEMLDDENPTYSGMLGRGLNISGALGVVAPVPTLVHLPALRR